MKCVRYNPENLDITGLVLMLLTYNVIFVNNSIELIAIKQYIVENITS